MSRAPLVLLAAAIGCAASFLAVTDQKATIAAGAARGESATAQKLAARQRQHDHGWYRHYRGYKEAPSAMVVSAHPV